MTVTVAGYQRVSHREEDSMNVEPSLSGKEIIGIIYPPPDIRTIVDKTASFVAKNGIEFENRIKEKEAMNPKFGFLAPSDPYHAYYKHQVEAGTNQMRGISAPPQPPPAALPAQAPEQLKEHIREKLYVPTEPPKPFEYMAEPSTYNGFELDTLRLTALFVATNGRGFLQTLMNKEMRNPQFEFLKPLHGNFPYFTKLVEQYSKIVVPSASINEDLVKSASFNKVMDDVKNRVAWERHQKSIKDKANEETEKERIAYAQIEWHDFVVVQTVDYQPSETSNLPPLCTPKDVGTRILMQQREEQRAAIEAVEMDVESDSEEEEEAPVVGESGARDQEGFVVPQPRIRPIAAQSTTSSDLPEEVIVRDYDPKKSRAVAKPKLAEEYVISPLTNEKIPARKLEEHVRYNTVDPQYKIQRDREMLERIDEDTNASGTEISRNIFRLAERRTDIFGVGEKGVEQTIIGKKLGEEERTAPRNEPRNIWDGQQSTIDATTRAAQHDSMPPPPPKAPEPPKEQPLPRPAVPVAPPLMAISTGYVPAPQQGFGIIPPIAPPRMIIPPPHIQDTMNQPPPKRARLEDELISEDIWKQNIPGDVNVIVSLPNATEWNVAGRQELITLDISSSVADLKAVIQDKCGIPSTKQKLAYEGMFMKDNFSLAYYNVTQNGNVQVQLKERGGRKK